MEQYYKIGKIKGIVVSNVTPDEKKKNLKDVYDVINKIADKQRLTGNSNNVEKWFYSQKELNSFKDNNISNKK